MTDEIINLIRPDLREFQAYRSAGSEALQGRIRLNANESPWENNEKLNRYPEPQPKVLREKLADFYGTHPENLLMTRGSDEAIDLLMRLFCEPKKDKIMICPPTYGMYEVSARLQGVDVLPVDLSENFQLDINKIISLIPSNQNCIKLIFLCSPNNPSGNLLKKSDILFLCEKFSNKSLIIIDEAYIEYANEKSLVEFINTHKNLVILRTLSKAFGLAGLRCGVLMGNQTVIAWLSKIIAPYPIPTLTSIKALSALTSENLNKIFSQINLIQNERNKLFVYLSGVNFIEKVWPSEANFILIKTVYAQKLFERCFQEGIVLRNMNNRYNLKNCIRLSIGLSEENSKLIEVLDKMRF